ncbi:MAG: helix-turn-helix transcriptional regulator [Thalassotalea sp.]
MAEVVFSWDIFIRGVVPFGAVHVFAMVLIYFTLVRDNIGNSYPFYALFIVSFILFLCGPIINVLPFDAPKHWYDLLRNVVLFGIGIPCLLLALLSQAQIKLTKTMIILPFVLGLAWCVLFIVAPPTSLKQASEFLALLRIKGIPPAYVYLSQLFLVLCLLVLPCIYLLLTKATVKTKNNTAIYIWGVLCLCFFMVVGILFRQWEVYYAGSSLTALIWAWAVFQDIQITHQKISHHAKHQELLAKAQYSKPNNASFTDYYPDKLNDAYPFRERETLIDVVCTASVGLVAAKVSALTTELKNFTQAQIAPYRMRAKEVLFMLFDSVVYQCGNAEVLINRLAAIGEQLEQSSSIELIDKIILNESQFLAQSILTKPEGEVDKRLIDQIKAFVLAHYHTEISINDLVKALGVSRTQLMKLFKAGTSQTINQYLTETRINKAKSILLVKSVTDTAFDVGFNNSAYFATVFKKQTGMTPKEYQLNAKAVVS